MARFLAAIVRASSELDPFIDFHAAVNYGQGPHAFDEGKCIVVANAVSLD